jgi:NAD(P)H-dependent FMN reductase
VRRPTTRLQIIIDSTRVGRTADQVASWVINRARAQGGFEVQVPDPRNWPRPIFAEHVGSSGAFNDPTYSRPIVRDWNRKINEAAAYLVITPEHNHSGPGVLKNAIDSAFVSFAFRKKPVVAVGYSGRSGGGVRAVEHLAEIAVEA